MQITIRPVREEDAPDITDIYNHYVTETTVSFETEALSTDSMRHRIKEISASYPYFVAEENGRVVGYCYIHQWKERAAYRNTMELTIYLDLHHKRKGTGTMLMQHLLTACRNMESCKNLIACITEENHDSIAFHERMGFKKVSHFRNVGFKFGKWLDVVDMELSF